MNEFDEQMQEYPINKPKWFQKLFIYKFFIYGLITILFLFLTLGLFFVWRFVTDKKFPKITEGFYIGEIVFENGRNLPLFVEAKSEVTEETQAEASELKVNAFILQDDWNKGMFVGIDRDGTPMSNVESYLEFIAPQTAQNNFQKVKLYGSETKNGYKGEILDVLNGVEGRWSLKKIDLIDSTSFIESVDSSSKQHDVTNGSKTDKLDSNKLNPAVNAKPISINNSRSLLSLFAQYEVIKDKLKELQNSIEEKTKEISSLKDFMLNESTDKNLAMDKDGNSVNIKEQKLNQLQQEVAEQKESAKKLNEHFKVAQKSIPSGRLIALARDYINLEAIYLENLLKGSSSSVVGQLQVDAPQELIERGEKALKLRNEIEAERIKIGELGR